MYNDQPAPVDMNNLYLMLCQNVKVLFLHEFLNPMGGPEK